ncbi:hypothetical protein WA026_012533 [Henosepilachna vigintioctopunctata]|uniref:DUF7041 domain-containing protein n=1 Tax=Henosepilachna vigintioctopunctata TaxID=420089 RepID=A0AAW1U6E8_9CUCU
MNNENEAGQIARVSVKLPSMWRNNIKLWFAQVESNFEIAGITNDSTKFNYVVAAIDTDILSTVSDIVLNPPAQQKYFTIKNRLCEEFSDSESRQTKKLIYELQLGDLKPSQLLRKMRELGNSFLSEDFLKTLWLQRLPSEVQTILAVSTESLDKLAKLADTIVDVKTDTDRNVCAVKVSNSEFEILRDEVKVLRQEIQELKQELRKGAQNTPRKDRRDSSGRSSSRDRTRNICVFHKKFGKNAYRCIQPCTFSEKLKEAVEIDISPTTRSVAEITRLYVYDKRNNLKFLVDSGSEVSCIPAPRGSRPNLCDLQLVAANNTKIYTFGKKLLNLDLGLRRNFAWKFIIASVPIPIIGADLIKHFDLLIDLKRKN